MSILNRDLETTMADDQQLWFFQELGATKDFRITKANILKEDRARLTQNENSISSLQSGDSRYQIGDIYLQFKGEDDPATKGLAGTWSNISINFAGQFFRVEGGAAAPFGSSQAHAAQRMIGAASSYNGQGIIAAGSQTGIIVAGVSRTAGVTGSSATASDIGIDTSAGGLYNTDGDGSGNGEGRPTNDTMRVWKRTS